jgi:hypothetical protein
MFWDLNIYEGSRLCGIPKGLKLPALFLRDLKNGTFRNLRKGNWGSLGFNYLVKKDLFVFDGVISRHDISVINTPRVRYAISKAADTCGRDYRIPMRMHQAIWCVDYVLANKATSQCSIVEIGTGRGFIMQGILASRDFINASVSNPIFLFDTFSQFSVGSNGKQESENGVHPFYAISKESTKDSFSKWKNVRLIAGVLPGSIGSVELGEIGFLHLDLNNPKVELECLQALWPKIQLGGVVLSDDYAYLGFNETYETLNNFFQEVGATVLTTAYGQGIVIKTS